MSSFGDGIRAFKRLMELEHRTGALTEVVGCYYYRLSGQSEGVRSYEEFRDMWERELPQYRREAIKLVRLADRLIEETGRQQDDEARDVAKRAYEARRNAYRAREFMFAPTSREDWIDKTSVLKLR